MLPRYDYIVIGGGSAGCVVAARLSERLDVNVLLLEAGGPDKSIFLRMPLAFRLLRATMMFDWGYATEPEAFAENRTVPAARGRVLGGSSSVNGMMYSRGHPRDYDQWAQMGAQGWSFEEVLPFFKKSEDNWRGASKHHGSNGPMGVARSTSPEPISAAMQATARKLGHRVLDDFEADVPEGFGLPDRTTARGRRSSASQAFLQPARSRKNLTIVTAAQATRIVFDGRRAVGMSYVRGGKSQTVHCDREIIVSGGTYASPQLLMLSGIGPADHLRSLGIDVVADLPGVGRNLQEHPLVPMGFSAKQSFVFGSRLRADRLLLSAAYWMLTGKGFPANLPLSTLAYYKSRPELERPDLENLFMPTSLNAVVWFPGVRKRVPDILTSLNVALRPESRGSVELRSSDPLAKPSIRFNLLQASHDLDLLRYAVRWTRNLLREKPVAEYVGAELFPGDQVASDGDINAYIRRSVVTAQHPVGTCKMGDRDDAVVDSLLRVQGLEGLRVADASVMPTLIGGHTNAPSVMIGEKAAHILLENRA